MEIDKLDDNGDQTKIEFGLTEGEKKNIKDLQIVWDECQEAYNESNEQQLLISSSRFEEEVEKNKIFPNSFIDELEIIKKLIDFLNSYQNQNFILNILKGLLHVFKCSNYALHVFIDLDPSKLLLMLLENHSVDICKVIFEIILVICQFNEGINFIISTPLIEYCFKTVNEILDILETNVNEISSDKDAVICLLNILIEIVKKCPPGTDKNIDVFLQIIHRCFDSQHYRSFIDSGVKILAYLLYNGFYEPLEKGLFQQVMHFLDDTTARSKHIWCLKLVTYIISFQNPSDDLNVEKLLDDAINQIPIEKVISFVINEDEKDIINECINILLNYVIFSDYHLQRLFDFTEIENCDGQINDDDDEQVEDKQIDFNDFMTALIKWMAEGNSTIMKSAHWLAWNMLYVGIPNQVEVILSTGILDYLEDSIEIEDEEFINFVVIRTISRLIGLFRQKGIESVEPFALYIYKMRDFMRDLYYSENSAVHKEADNFFRDFYPDLKLE